MKAELKLVLLLVVLSFLLLCITISAQQLGSFKEQIKIEENGKAEVEWVFTLNNNTSHDIRFPWNFTLQNENAFNPSVYASYKTKKGSDSLVSVDSKKIVKLIKQDGITFVQFSIDNSVRTSTWKITFHLNDFVNLNEEKAEEFGNHEIKYRFVNTTFAQVNSFETTIVLPHRYVVVSVDETIPKQTEDNPVSPFQLKRVGTQNAVTVKVAKLKLGDHAFAKLTVKHEKKSPVVLVVFGLVGILYLFYFRDLTGSNNQNGNSVNTNN